MPGQSPEEKAFNEAKAKYDQIKNELAKVEKAINTTVAQINKERRKTGKNRAEQANRKQRNQYNPLMENSMVCPKKAAAKKEYLAAARNKMNMFGRNLNELGFESNGIKN